MDARTADAIMRASGLVLDGSGVRDDASFDRQDGTRGRVTRTVEHLGGGPLSRPSRFVVQVSRWDRLKDPVGVLDGFLHPAGPDPSAHLVLAGPAADSTADDPDAAEVLSMVRSRWQSLDERDRDRVHVASLPMDDVEENAAIVNALQRTADVVVQKSLAEGFGLTVAEAMWKERPVVATRVGGIQDQVVHGRSGLLIDDPNDLGGFGEALTTLLDGAELAERMGREAHDRVREEFLAPHYLTRSLDLIERVVAGDPVG
jgi:trehalose synthase